MGSGEENGRTLLATAAWENGAWRLSVWEPHDLSEPIQTITAEGSVVERVSTVGDFNFDGDTDFGYAVFLGAHNNVRYTFWLWDEEQGLFVESPECSALCNPQFDVATETVSSYIHRDAGAFTKEFYHWQDGALAAVRQIDVGGQMVETGDGPQLAPALPEATGPVTQTLVVTDWVNENRKRCTAAFLRPAAMLFLRKPSAGMTSTTTANDRRKDMMLCASSQELPGGGS